MYRVPESKKMNGIVSTPTVLDGMIHELDTMIGIPPVMHIWLRKLLRRYQGLEDEVQELKTLVAHRPHRLTCLLMPAYIPESCFSDWMTLSREYTFEPAKFESLLSEMKRFIEESPSSQTSPIGIPVREMGGGTAGSLALFTLDREENAPSWKLCTDELWDMFVRTIVNAVVKAFCAWEDKNEAFIFSPEGKDVHVSYLIKISGQLKDKDKQEFKKWLILKPFY